MTKTRKKHPDLRFAQPTHYNFLKNDQFLRMLSELKFEVCRKTDQSNRIWCIMAVNIRKSYVCTAVEVTNTESILAVMNTTELIIEIRPKKKFRAVRDLNSWPLRYLCVSSTAVHTYDFHKFTAFIHHFEVLFESNIMTGSQLAWQLVEVSVSQGS